MDISGWNKECEDTLEICTTHRESYYITQGLPGASLMVPVVKNLPANAGDARDPVGIPGSGRSPGEGHGNPLQYSYLEILWTVGPGGLQSIGSQRVGYDTAYSHAF